MRKLLKQAESPTLYLPTFSFNYFSLSETLSLCRKDPELSAAPLK